MSADKVQTVAELARLLRQLRRRQARARGNAEVTYRSLAARTGWSIGSIGAYLGGKTLPPTDRFDILTRLLGASPREQGALATLRDRLDEHRRALPPNEYRTASDRPALLERAELLDELAAALTACADGGRIVLLAGEAGSAKPL